MNIILRRCFIYGWLFINSFAQNAVYVAKDGRDINVGTINSPVLSLHKAIEISRNLKCHKIIIREGRYFNNNVNLCRADSGLIIENYPDELPILYGGIIIRHWQKENIFIYTEIAGVKERRIDFRMILVNDSLRDISRLPANGYYSYQNRWNVKSLPSIAGWWERQPTQLELTNLIYNPKDLDENIDINNAEITVVHQWEESYFGIKQLDTTNHIISLSYPAVEPLGSFNHTEYVIWNTKEGLLNPGMWYLDRSKERLYYWPKDGETIDNIEVIIPIHRQIFSFEKGTSNITIRGLKLCATTNKLQNENFAAENIDAAISGNDIYNIKLEHLSFVNTGGSGIKLFGRNISISNSVFINIYGSGIFIGGEDIKVDNCHITDVGIKFRGSVGIRMVGRKNLIKNCFITNIPYSGICMSGILSTIMNCQITNAMMFYKDGAAIYCGHDTDIVVKNNKIIGCGNVLKYTMGIYFDELACNCIAMNNIVMNTTIPIHCYMANNIQFIDNIFYDNNRQNINWGGSNNILIDNNIFMANSFQFSGPTVDDKKKDLYTSDPRLRAYANASGLVSFRNNLLFVVDNYDKLDSIKYLPKIRNEFMHGTIVKGIISKKLLQEEWVNFLETSINHQIKSGNIRVSEEGKTWFNNFLNLYQKNSNK